MKYMSDVGRMPGTCICNLMNSNKYFSSFKFLNLFLPERMFQNFQKPLLHKLHKLKPNNMKILERLLPIIFTSKYYNNNCTSYVSKKIQLK